MAQLRVCILLTTWKWICHCFQKHCFLCSKVRVWHLFILGNIAAEVMQINLYSKLTPLLLLKHLTALTHPWFFTNLHLMKVTHVVAIFLSGVHNRRTQVQVNGRNCERSIRISRILGRKSAGRCFWYWRSAELYDKSKQLTKRFDTKLMWSH